VSIPPNDEETLVMIARMWQARTDGPAAAERYREVFTTEVLDHLRGLTGFRGAYLLARDAAEATELRTLTLFDSMAAVRRFTGADVERERVTPAARATLLDSDPVVRHYDVTAALPPA
jgi:heme-degrading monooxygenase HmoA